MSQKSATGTARRGIASAMAIPAHTLSSFNMHIDYHQPSDEVELVDFEHMAALVEAAIQAVRFLASGPRPAWVEGGTIGVFGN